ncbi:hypothetical protein [Streptomyces sp. NPDC094032]|uniref:hypothetical protein n=1 Tax=Streptomyces sp. NPDC094032 TaxID=3155308 RepID=UPI0033166041
MTHRTEPPPVPFSVVQAADGTCWRTAGRAPDGEQLYVLDGVDVETCARWVRVGEAELVELVGALTPVVDRTEAGAR